MIQQADIPQDPRQGIEYYRGIICAIPQERLRMVLVPLGPGTKHPCEYFQILPVLVDAGEEMSSSK